MDKHLRQLCSGISQQTLRTLITEERNIQADPLTLTSRVSQSSVG